MNRPRYLLDTDMCIYLLNRNERIKSRVASIGIESVCISIPTVAELYFGAYNSPRSDHNISRVRNFLLPPGPPILTMDKEAAEYFGRFKARLRQQGRPIGDIDLLIAGIAASRNLIVVTNNTDHFARIEEISLENWMENLPRRTGNR